jgi:hypothetical protein
MKNETLGRLFLFLPFPFPLSSHRRLLPSIICFEDLRIPHIKNKPYFNGSNIAVGEKLKVTLRGWIAVRP